MSYLVTESYHFYHKFSSHILVKGMYVKFSNYE